MNAIKKFVSALTGGSSSATGSNVFAVAPEMLAPIA
jgi:hypothetical protein